MSPSAEDPRRLFRELRETAREAAVDPVAARTRRDELRGDLAATPWSDELATATAEHLSHVTSRLELLGGATTGAEAASREVAELRGDLTWLPLAFPRSALEETVAALEAEVDSAAVVARTATEEARSALATCQEELLEVKRTRLRRAADLLEEESDLDQMWRAYLEARELRARGGVGQNTAKRIRKRIAGEVPDLPPEAACAALCQFAAEYEDMSLDLLAMQAEMPPSKAATALDEGRGEMRWLRVLLRETTHRSDLSGKEAKPLRRRLEQCGRRLARVARRLSREAQELRLQARLEGIFGPRFVAFFENLILWLILAVLVVLLVEALIPRGTAPWFAEIVWPGMWRSARYWHQWHVALAWIDTAICAVFLLEFFTKLALVKGKLRWFWRHFLVDFIPSIPYGLLAVHALDALRTVRAVRFFRFARLARYVRIARPAMRFLRFFGFLQRGVDRMVRLHGGLLNRNIVLFEPERMEAAESEFAELLVRVRQTRALARTVWRRTSRDLPAGEQGAQLVRLLSAHPPCELLCSLEPSTSALGRQEGGLLRAEEVVDHLTELDPGTVETELGEAGARRIAQSLARLDVPLLRNLPLIRPMVKAAREGEQLAQVTAAGRALGRYLERLLGRVHWVSDLSGIISGPQFLDRLGSAMVQATARPAKRLLFFGFGFLLLKGFVHLLGWTALTGIATWLERTLGVPFLILGAGCLAILLIGTWFRRIAGEATDFYARTAEAQYINLLKSAKLANLEEDLGVLWDRVLRPEAVLQGQADPDDDSHLRAHFSLQRSSVTGRGHVDRVLQLYHDYLDGALFHITDTKTSSQLLGNLALENIRNERLGTSRKERRRLDELDLDRDRSSLRGPYLWFRSITHSVAQWTAKLILEYNHRAIPLAEQDDHPPERLREMENWLDGKLGVERADRATASEEEQAFHTTWFSALHFLTADEDRDRAVAERFGERILAALQADRQAMIRTIFGTYPFHRLPRADRTLNPFDLYSRYLAGGKILLLPWTFLRLTIRLLRWFYRRLKETIREILDPSRMEGEGRRNWASYDVAVRKIHRMRKPLFMECATFRAAFDPEYLGLLLTADEDSGVEGRTFREDLERIDARDEEWDSFNEVREDRDAALRDFAATVKREGSAKEFINGLRGTSASTPFREAYRAVAVAYAIDYRSCRTLDWLEERAEAMVREVLRRKGRVEGTGLIRRALRLLVPSRNLKAAFQEYLRRFPVPSLTKRERRHVWRAVRADWRGLRRLVVLAAAQDPATSPREASRAVLRRVAKHPETWSEQLVTLRTVQSLSVLDVRNYRRQVWALGGYGNE